MSVAKAQPPKTLVIAEKPSVAADLAKALGGKFEKEKTHFEDDHTIISWAIGHLVTIADPKEMGDQYKNWSLETLPILPEVFKLTPIADSKSQLTALGKLIRRKDVGTIINACDAGREGELIFHYILEHEQGKTGLANKTIQRLWMQSMTQGAIREAFAHLRSGSEMKNLQDAALSRSEADWLVGINGSRGLTAYNSRFGGFQLTPCGRVQTPTLTLIVKREDERLAFVPKSFWTVSAAFEGAGAQYEGKWFDPAFKKDENSEEKDNAQRLWDNSKAEAIVKKCQGKTGTVEEVSKPSTHKCPPLYDLTSLQREANSRYGFSAKTTLQIAQALYERHKLTTYPRTDSKFLPEDYVPTVQQTMASFSDSSVGKHADFALAQGYVRKAPHIFNNAKVSDHHAIIPTGNAPKALSEAEQKIFNMITLRFIAVFYPAAIYLNTTRTTTIEGENFRTEGKVMQEAGWRAVYGKDADDEKMLPALPAGAKPKATDVQAIADVTRAPARYTESSLLSVMEGAGKLIDDDELRDAMKDRGLGTPATRAATIEKLLSDKYLVRDGKELVPTSKAFDLIRITSAMKIEDLTSPELTGEWEYKLGLIEKGQFTREKFMGEIVELTSRMVRHIKGFQEESTRTEAPFSPVNGHQVFETVSRYETEGGIQIRKMLGGRHMASDEVRDLLVKKKIGPLTGFRSKRGSEFSAALVLTDKGKIEFVFQDDDTAPDGEAFDINTQEPIGKSPVDASPVYETLTAFVSQTAMEKAKTGLRVNKVILGKEITRDNMVRMLNGEKTELIQGFRSSKTRKLFDAFLTLSKEGKIGFEFPPRAAGAGRRFPVRKPAAKKEEEDGE